MACIKTIGASIEQQTLAEADPEAQDKDKDRDKEREAETETGTDTEAETETDARIMATGICIIRLITLKRFLEDSTTDEHNQRRQPSTATSAASAGAAGASAAASQPRRRPTHYPGSSSAPPAVHPEATLLLLLLLLTSLWPEGCECLHGGSNTVKTKYGLLRGIVVRSSPLVEAFLGIPYASPPVGSLRWVSGGVAPAIQCCSRLRLPGESWAWSGAGSVGQPKGAGSVTLTTNQRFCVVKEDKDRFLFVV